MYTDVKITLQKLNYGIVDGVEKMIAVSTSCVWAQHRTATRTEFYAAEKAGHKVTDIFTIYSFEYSGQQKILHGGKEYDVIRVYQKERDRMELSCERRDAE